MKLLVIGIFLLSYLLIILRRTHPFLVLTSAIILLLFTKTISPGEAFLSINFNVLGVFLGTTVLSSLFVFSGVPAYLAIKLVQGAKNVGMAILGVCFLSSLISAFVENVATVLIVAPIALEVAKRLKANPVPFLIGIAVCSNLQGSATLVGDSPSIILALSHGMNFMDFFWFKHRPGIAFAVELGALVSFGVLYFLFKRYKQPSIFLEGEKVKSWFPTLLLMLMILTLAFSSFFKNRSNYTIAFICLGYALVGVFWHILKHKEAISLIKDLDWHTFFFLVGIFILVGSLTLRGVIDDIARFLVVLSKGDKFFAYAVIVWVSVLLSAFVDNIPYTMAMVPVARLLAQSLGVNPELFLFGLLIGTTVGGNITPVGAAANVVAVGFLRKHGYRVRFSDFIKIGLPFTLSAVLAAFLFLWWVWAN